MGLKVVWCRGLGFRGIQGLGRFEVRISMSRGVKLGILGLPTVSIVVPFVG